jgi:hypothetical protein
MIWGKSGFDKGRGNELDVIADDLAQGSVLISVRGNAYLPPEKFVYDLEELLWFFRVQPMSCAHNSHKAGYGIPSLLDRRLFLPRNVRRLFTAHK